MVSINDRYNDCVRTVRDTVVRQDDELREFLNDMEREGSAGPPQPGSVLQKTMDGAFQYHVNNLLSGPQTQILNMANNGINATMRPLTTLTAAAWDTILPVGADRVYAREALAELHGMAVGMADAFEFIQHVITNPGTTFEQHLAQLALPKQLAITSKLEQQFKAINGNNVDNEIVKKGLDYLGTVIGIPGTFLTSGDIFSKIVNYRMTQHKLAMRDVLNSNTPELGEAAAYIKRRQGDAVADAEYHTLTSKPVGPIGRLFTSSHRAIGWARWIVPFRRTLANWISYGVDHSPLAAMSSRTYAALKEGGPAASEALGRMSAGTLLIAGATYLLDGNIDGDAPRGLQEKHAWEANGHRANTLRIGGMHIRLDTLGPMAPWLKAYANWKQTGQNVRWDMDPEAEQKWYDASVTFLFELGDAMLDSAWFTNAQEFMAMVSRTAKADQPDPLARGSAAMVYADRFMTGFVPAKSFVSPLIQEYWQNYKVDWTDPMGAPFARTRELLMAWQKELPRQVGLWGDYITYDRWLDPKYQDPVSGEDEVYNYLKSLNVNIPISERVREGVKLSPGQYEMFMIYAGKGGDGQLPLRDKIIEVVGSKFYQNIATDEGKAVVLENVIQSYRDAATEWLKRVDPEFATATLKVKDLKQAAFSGELKL